MKLRPSFPEIPADNPFANCKLGREPLAKILTSVIDCAEGGFTMAISIDGIPYLGDYRRLDKLPVLNFESHKVEQAYAYNLIRDLEKLNDGIALSDLYHLIDISLPFTKDDLTANQTV